MQYAWQYDAPKEMTMSDQYEKWARLNPWIMTTCSMRSLTFKGLKYCESLDYDVLILTELWRKSPEFADGSLRWLFGKAPKGKTKLDRSGNPIFAENQYGGVAILLSKAAQGKCLRHGTPCERIVWVQLEGPVTNLFVIGVDMSNSTRKQPSQHNTLSAITSLLKKVPASDCVLVLGNLTVQLPAKIQQITGKWAHHTGKACKNAEGMLRLMRMFELSVAHTFCQPKRKHSTSIFRTSRKRICSTRTVTDSTDASAHFIGRKVRTKYLGRTVTGKVVDCLTVHGIKRWTISFTPDFKANFGKKWLMKHLVPSSMASKKSRHPQTDYILISRRWVSSITKTAVKWEPSIRINEGRGAHTLVLGKWRWRLRAAKAPPCRNWRSLDHEFHSEHITTNDKDDAHLNPRGTASSDQLGNDFSLMVRTPN